MTALWLLFAAEPIFDPPPIVFFPVPPVIFVLDYSITEPKNPFF